VAVEARRARPARAQNGSSVVEFEPIQQLRAHEYVAEQVRRHIALRLICPGESLPSERELAAIFGVGRPTIQHALRLLEADGLLVARRGRRGGTFVAEPAEDSLAMDELMTRVLRQRSEIEEVLVYRQAIEPAVARTAAGVRRASDMKAMWRAIDQMSNAADDPEYMRHDTEFHLAVARASGNRFMLAAIEDIRLRLNDAISLLPESDTWHRRLSREHHAIAEAIEHQDSAGARQAMSAHVSASDQGLRALLAAIGRRRR
jgi:GntR family transcriptional regulator, transcriptional repressor for pyruvate dehydrogenase complex